MEPYFLEAALVYLNYFFPKPSTIIITLLTVKYM